MSKNNTASIFINRELSWLSFNERVLREALDSTNPIMEQLKFVAIFSSNLDEFFMVRVAGLKEQELSDDVIEDISGHTPSEQLKDITGIVRSQMELQQEIFTELSTKLKMRSVVFNPPLSDDLEETAEDIFIDEIMSIITPVTLDPVHPFPFIYNKRISIISTLERDGKEWLSLIMLPENIQRYFKVKIKNKIYVLTTDYIIKHNLSKLYKGFEVKNSYVFRVTRDADLEVKEEEAADLLSVLQSSLARRNKGAVTRIEIEPDVPKHVVDLLKKQMQFKNQDIYTIDGIIDLTFLMGLSNLIPSKQFPELKSRMLTELPNDKRIFERIKQSDIYFYRPFYSFSTISKLISIAADDPSVLAIKMTLYRTNKDSSILASLQRAAKSGKQVSVVVELKARFDEERNIGWARHLEESGCIVTYGVPGFKIHAKCLLIVRREKDEIVRYTHVATGNYNESTADVYTDLDLVTADERIGRDAVQLFNYLMGYTDERSWLSLFVAPYSLRQKLESMLDEAIAAAKQGKPASIIMKMNSLIDKQLMEKMYDASNANVKISLIVRGICGIRAGVKGLSENISVRSIIGRFLEHSRIFYFNIDGVETYFMASADLMPRNLNWRVELMTQINDLGFQKSLKKYLEISLADNTKAWELHDDVYKKPSNVDKPINSQMFFLENDLIY